MKPGQYSVAHRAVSLVMGAAIAFLLASCGGGDDAKSSASGDSRSKAQDVTPPQTFFPPITIPADANVRGMWSPVYNWPIVAVHATLLPDGRVLTFGSSLAGIQGASGIYDVWDSTVAPDTGHQTLTNGTGTDIFCSSTLMLPPTSLISPAQAFIAGGDNFVNGKTTNTANPNTNVFDVNSSVLSRQSNMNRARWYSTSTTLISGETYIQGGNSGGDRPEIRGLDGTFRLLSGANTSGIDSVFPRNFVAPDGRIFGFDSNGGMYYINTAGNGSVTGLGTMSGVFAGWTGSAAMFRPGRILQIGGNSNSVAIIDITGATPSITQTQSISSQRQWVNATVLPDGKVLATSGSQVADQLTGVNTKAEIWDPTTGQWLQGSAGVRPRLYHSNALLLPDASVLIGGGGATAPTGYNPASDNLNAEIYYPPYLFTANGQRASRPIIASAPDWVDIGKVLSVDVQNAASISRVTLVKSGASTHSFNMDQRFLDLTFNATGTHLAVQAPTRAADATPGFYLLFVFNESGVPSVAKMVRLGIAPVQNPAITPTLLNPGAQATNNGTQVNLPLVASDPNGDTLSFTATGLPPGLSINSATGVISGAPTANGTYDVVVTTSDGVNAASANFVWSVSGTNPVVLDPLPPVTPVQSNLAVSFTASAHGGSNVVYRWNFGDGTGDSAWSSQATVSHTFTSPGTYVVTLSVSDDSLSTVTTSFLQSVYLPSTANSPRSSSNMVIETPTAGNPRLWVVNQDNDSVSVFDAKTYAKLGEVAVEAAPRSVAVAQNGLVWVTNKRGDSISIIDPATRAVVNRVALPRASQPFGIAMSPTAAQAFVVLEATGQLLKFDTTSYAQLGSASVGNNPRQLAISADGASVYVSRFVTSMLPGESTATVNPTPSTGGELVVISAGGMSFMRTIVLQYSDKPDTEISGGGIPNYLGAPAISPDGTQAWVPSKQDNVKRGALRNSTGLNFQNTVRAISSRVVLSTGQEDLSKRVDHDNASLASAAVYDTRGVYLFVALETSREVAVVDAFGGFQVMRFDAGRAPQGLALSADGQTLFVNNFMDRTVGVYDLKPLLTAGQMTVPLVTTLGAVTTEKLAANVLNGKQLFYDARDTRLARDRYMSCATCHSDGGSDGRVWDFTGQGEGLRNTIALRGRAGAQGPLHWSGNFDEIQDFEGQIRSLAGGTGLMSDAAFNTGTRSQPMGDPKAGLSADLDALAAYVSSLSTFESSPNRSSDGSLSAAATAGRGVFIAKSCASCHGGANFTLSGTLGLQDIGTLKPTSGQRLGGPLTGIDIPTLRDVWRTGPYLHDGSAPTLDEAVLAHNAITITSGELTSLVAFLREIGGEEPAPPAPTGALSGSVSTAATAVNLTTLGTSDWAAWGNTTVPGIVRKSGGASQISAYTQVGTWSDFSRYNDDQRQVSWTDGTPTATGSANRSGIYVGDGIGSGFSLTVPASTTSRTVTVLVGGWNSGGTLTAHLTDGSSADYVDTSTAVTTTYYRTYTLTYTAATTTTLSIRWVQASGSGNVTLKAVALNGGVAAPNQPPVVTTPAAQTSTQGVAASLAITASDPNGDVLSYSATGLPAGLSINASTGLISGTPTTVGTSSTVVTVSDGRGGSATASFSWTVQAPPNQPPVVTTPVAQTSTQGVAASLAISASDPNGDVLSYSATGLPAGLSISSTTGLISGTPTTLGSNSVVVTVSDGRGGSATASFSWTIQAPVPNQPPVVTTPASQSTIQGQTASLTISASDPNGDVLSYSATGLPAGLSISATTGVISGSPTTAGTSSVVVTVSDGRGGTATASFGWTVIAATGVINGGVSTATTAVNLTTLGTSDWAAWGNTNVPGLIRKATGGSQISAYTQVGQWSDFSRYNDDQRQVSWTDGATTVTSTANRSGIYVGDGIGSGFSLTVPASATTRTVTVLVGGWNSGGTLTAHLGDSSGVDFVDTSAVVATTYYRTYTLTYTAATATTLTIRWVQANGSGNVTLKAVAVQ